MLQSYCGMRLNTAAVVVGWIGAALSLISIIIYSVCLGRMNDVVNFFMERIQDFDITEEYVRVYLIIIFIFYLTTNLINMIASALLIVGTVKERHLLLIPWLFNSGVSLLFNVVYFVFLGSISSSNNFFIVSLVISAVITLGTQYYTWYAIYSLFKYLQASREEQEHLLPSDDSTASNPRYT